MHQKGFKLLCFKDAKDSSLFWESLIQPRLHGT